MTEVKSPSPRWQWDHGLLTVEEYLDAVWKPYHSAMSDEDVASELGILSGEELLGAFAPDELARRERWSARVLRAVHQWRESRGTALDPSEYPAPSWDAGGS